MKFLKKLWCITVTLSVSLSGCCKKPPEKPSPPVLVTRVDVSYRGQEGSLQRSYTAADKIDRILIFIYSLSPAGRPAEDPEQIALPRCRITTVCSNSQTHTYLLRGERYLSADCRPWQQIDPRKSGELLQLLLAMPGDM